MASDCVDYNIVMTVAVGLVGYGPAGRAFHARLVQAVPALRLAAVVTSRIEDVRRDWPGVRVEATIGELLADPSLELVVIASPTPVHFEHARDALRAGKHVVIDKPMATTAAQAESLIALALAEQRMLTVFQNRRWDSDFLTLEHALAQGWLGAIATYEAHFDRFRPVIKAGWREEAQPGSGALYDLGAHLLDQAIHLFGMPEAVTADILAQRPGASVPDYFHLLLEHGKMRAILHSGALVAAPGPRFQVHGDRASLLTYGVDGQEEALRAGGRPASDGWLAGVSTPHAVLTEGSGSPRSLAMVPGAYVRFYEQVAACVRGGGPAPVDPRDARDGLAVMEAAMRSARERRTVALGGLGELGSGTSS